jgi:hypothetical protein
VSTPIAGVAAGQDVVFVGEPLNASVIAVKTHWKQVGELSPPPNGFALPFILHNIGKNKVAILDAGGLPRPSPFVPASPTIYVYSYTFNFRQDFSAQLVRTVSFASVLIGFFEDFILLEDGRDLLSDDYAH